MSTGDWELFVFFLDILGRFPKSDMISTFFPEITQGLLLHFRGLCTQINLFLAKKSKKPKKLKSDNYRTIMSDFKKIEWETSDFKNTGKLSRTPATPAE